MSVTTKHKTVGRPKGTGCVEITLAELQEQFGGDTKIPVRYKWLELHRGNKNGVVKNGVCNNTNDQTKETTPQSPDNTPPPINRVPMRLEK